jgi:hypothetical protein
LEAGVPVGARIASANQSPVDRFHNAALNGKRPAMLSWRDKVRDEDLKLL